MFAHGLRMGCMQVDKYLAAAGYLPPNVRPFFVALPKVRGPAPS